VAANHHQELLYVLTQARVAAGNPSGRAIAEASDGRLSHTTVADVLSGRHIPSRDILEALLDGMAAKPAHRRRARMAWEAALLARVPVVEPGPVAAVTTAIEVDIVIQAAEGPPQPYETWELPEGATVPAAGDEIEGAGESVWRVVARRWRGPGRVTLTVNLVQSDRVTTPSGPAE
jgi:hypothetical protein